MAIVQVIICISDKVYVKVDVFKYSVQWRNFSKEISEYVYVLEAMLLCISLQLTGQPSSVREASYALGSTCTPEKQYALVHGSLSLQKEMMMSVKSSGMVFSISR